MDDLGYTVQCTIPLRGLNYIVTHLADGTPVPGGLVVFDEHTPMRVFKKWAVERGLLPDTRSPLEQERRRRRSMKHTPAT